MSEIVLINPPVENIIEEYDAPDYPHIGLGYLGASLEAHGFKTSIVDAKLEKLSFDRTLKRTLALSPEVIGITSMTHEIILSHELVSQLKKAGSRAHIVVGGVHVSAIPEKTLQEFPAFDVGVIGEGESTIGEICEEIIRHKRSIIGIPGTVCRKSDGHVHTAPQRPRIEDLDSLPFPAWHLFPFAKQYPILTSRGCPSRCIFCAHSYGYRLRSRTPENVLKEWKHIFVTYSPRLIRVYDETFGINTKRAITLLDMVIKEGLMMPWLGYTRANVASVKLMEKMKAAGCRAVGIGVETGDPDIMRLIQKGITKEDAERAIHCIRNAGMDSEAYFILGFPNENMRTVSRTIRFASHLNTTKLALGIMVPYPGTEVARMAAAGEGGYKIISDNWKDYNKQIGNALELERLSRRQLELAQLFGYIFFYLSNWRINDFIHFVWNYRSQAIGFLRHFFGLLLKSTGK